MMLDRLTLMGIISYDDTLFDDVVTPTGLNKDDLIGNIVEMCGDLYPYNQHPTYLKRNITRWFRDRKDNWERMIVAITSEYNPIENYDRTEEESINNTLSSSNNATKNGTINSSDNNDSENKVSAYDSNDYTNERKTTTRDIAQTTTTDSVISSQSDTGAMSRHSRVHGNIGVTTNQQMIESELKLRVFDIYDVITKQFEEHFMVQIY